MKLQIKNWNEHYENFKSRSIDKLGWVPIPNDISGVKICRIMTEPDGLAAFGLFILLVEIASRSAKPREGWLTDNGREDGNPMTIDELSFMLRRDASELSKLIQVLTNQRIGWVVDHSGIPQGYCEDTTRIPQGYHRDTGVSLEYPDKGIEENRKKESTYLVQIESGSEGALTACAVESEDSSIFPDESKQPSPQEKAFEEFWKAYPRKEGKGAARKSFLKIKKASSLLPCMIESIGKSQKSEQWRKNNGQFIPLPATWLNQCRWEDEGTKVENPIFEKQTNYGSNNPSWNHQSGEYDELFAQHGLKAGLQTHTEDLPF